MFKLLILLSITICECVYLYSNFWAPKMLNYKVDVEFDPNVGKIAAERYQNLYGYRGDKLISDLGKGKTPQDIADGSKVTVPINLSIKPVVVMPDFSASMEVPPLINT